MTVWMYISCKCLECINSHRIFGLVMLWLFLLTPGCSMQSQPAPQLESPPAPATTAAQVRNNCAAYSGIGDVESYCASRIISSVRDITDVDSICKKTGIWETACRQSWVEPRLHPSSGYSIEQLRSVCARDQDCLLDVLDHRSLAIHAQLQACEEWTPDRLRHCISHAIDRWRLAGPEATVLANVQQAEWNEPELVGEYLAEVVACEGIGSCGTTSPLGDSCRVHASRLQENRRDCILQGVAGSPNAHTRGGAQPQQRALKPTMHSIGQ